MAKERKQRKRKYIPRNTIQFQMDLRKQDDLEVLKIHEWAASNGKALQMFRDGFRLINALQQGDLTVLYSLFPDLNGSLTPHDENLIEQFRQMVHSEIKENIVIQQLPLPGMQAAPAGLKPMPGAHEIAMPTFDELDEDEDADNIVLVRNAKADENAVLSFINSVKSI